MSVGQSLLNSLYEIRALRHHRLIICQPTESHEESDLMQVTINNEIVSHSSNISCCIGNFVDLLK